LEFINCGLISQTTPLPLTPRTAERHRIRCWLTICVNHRKILARAVDLSGSGATVESLFPVAVGSKTQIRSHVSLLAGSAHVRYCKRRGLVYRIGLEFSRPFAERF
jgi:hypothetical protein